MLYIICPQSYRYKKPIEALCERVGLKDIQIVDPKNYEVNRAYPYVLVVGNVPGLHIDARKIWQCNPPDPELPKEDKLKILESFKEVQKYIINNKEPAIIDSDSIPRLKDFEEFLKGYKGQVMELKLPDGRLLGIYPDGERLQMTYPVENHVSTILNLSRMKDMFDITRIAIKDL
ncbi:MAG: hypothetical protein PHY47_01095 [Lachnospiraceae bacterium]|nr:hypothetical protein [Lachnospiraceae bacterium]